MLSRRRPNFFVQKRRLFSLSFLRSVSFLFFVLFPFFLSFVRSQAFFVLVRRLVGWLVLQEVSIFSRTVFYPGKTLNIASNKILKHKYLIVLSQVAFLIFLPIYYLQLIVHGVIYVTLSYDLFR